MMMRSLSFLLVAAAAIVVSAQEAIDDPPVHSLPISSPLEPPTGDPSRRPHGDTVSSSSLSAAVASGITDATASATASASAGSAAIPVNAGLAAAFSTCASDVSTTCPNTTSAEACLANLRGNWSQLEESCRSAMSNHLPCMEDAANHCPSAITGAQLGSCLMSVQPESLSSRCVSWLQNRRHNWQASWIEREPKMKDSEDDDASASEGGQQQWHDSSRQDFFLTLLIVSVLSAAIGACCTMCCSRRRAGASSSRCCCRNGGCAPGGGGGSGSAVYTANAATSFDPRGIAYSRPLPLEHMPTPAICGMRYAVLTDEVTSAAPV